jgi:hypothetical protein
MQAAEMSSGLPADNASTAEAVRQRYEGSLSWRLTRPLRGLRRRRDPTPPEAPQAPPLEQYDSWLTHLCGDRLGEIESACSDSSRRSFALFRDLDLDVWALLLTQQYSAYPKIRELLPDVPEPEFQGVWNGASGAALAAQSAAFYRKLTERYRQHGERSLADSRVLDFGCGWGRLTRFFLERPGACSPVWL